MKTFTMTRPSIREIVKYGLWAKRKQPQDNRVARRMKNKDGGSKLINSKLEGAGGKLRCSEALVLSGREVNVLVNNRL